MLALAPSQSEYMAHNECSVLPEGHRQIHDGGGLSLGTVPSARWSPTQDRAVPQDVAWMFCRVLRNPNVMLGHPIPATPMFLRRSPCGC